MAVLTHHIGHPYCQQQVVVVRNPAIPQESFKFIRLQRYAANLTGQTLFLSARLLRARTVRFGQAPSFRVLPESFYSPPGTTSILSCHPQPPVYIQRPVGSHTITRLWRLHQCLLYTLFPQSERQLDSFKGMCESTERG